MCGRFALSITPRDIANVFRTAGALPNTEPTWNMAPRQTAPIVRRHPQSGERHLDLLRWGLVPHFERDLKAARQPINARAETVAKVPAFRDAFARRRCLVPAEAFYEWKHVGAAKQPFAIARFDGAPLAFGGLWESWTDPASKDVIRTFAIITTDANATMAPIHNRMPVILEPADWPVWLGEVDGDPGGLLRPAGDGVLRIWPVSTEVNNARHNGPGLLKRMLEEGEGGGPNPA